MLHRTDLLDARDLAGFAAANGWRYDAVADPPALGENLWEQVSSGTVHDRISGEGWEAGTITGGSRTASTEETSGGWTVTTSVSLSTPRSSMTIGYLAITLPRRMPHMILDALSNGSGASGTRQRPLESQHLSLEGDFDTHFRLYVPRGYETDALYVFTPDFMALLIDETGDLDVAVQDDQLIVSRPGGFDLHSPRTWKRFAELRARLGAKAWERTALYVDERVPSGLAFEQVAEPAQRLKRRFGGPLWLFIAIPVGVFAIIGTVGAIVLSNVLR